MQRVIKRDGREVEFDKSKIIKAISHANQEIIKSKQIGSRKINQLASIVEEKCKEYKRAIKVEDINDLIEDELISRNYNDLVRTFIRYRYNKELVRKSNTTDDSILSLINLSNEELKQENSNKNPVVNSTQRDYMAGEVSKDLTIRLLLPKDVVKAHEDGILHFHDSDYFVQKMHNCFAGQTTFVTDTGISRFDSFNDGDPVYVKDKDGVLRLAHVKKYGKQSMNRVTLLFRGGNQSTTKEIICTPNHRWLLQDGSVTTTLAVGDYLYHTGDPVELPIETYDDARAFCLGFIVGDGFDHNDHTTIRLCGDKIAYSYIFDLAGFHKYNSKNAEDDILYDTKNFSKQAFLDCFGWRYLSVKQKVLVFRGLYAADGATSKNMLTTADSRVCQLIDELADLAGYHISSKVAFVHDTNFKAKAELTRYRFITKTKHNYGWRVVNIESYRNGELKDAWCVEEPITHSFTLSNGVITGNCDLVNLEDMLQNGTVVSGTLIEKPHSFATACNIATQIIAQVSSNQYGGQSITLSHLAPFVDVSRQKIRKEVIEEFDMVGLDADAEAKINAITERRVRAEVKRGVQTIQYQVNTLLTTNG